MQTVVGSPTPGATATPGSLGLDLSRKKNKRRNGHSGNGSIVDEGCLDGNAGKKSKKKRGELVGSVVDSTSTTASECDLLNSNAPDDALGGDTPRATERSDGTPTPANPGYSVATPGAAPIGVPNFFIDKFRIPPFLLPIYQAAGIEYGVRWEVLAAINEIETDYGRNLNVSSAGALGWMQFMPATWQQYGVDANRDGVKDPFNPVDAIFAAARYLRAAGADTDVRRAIFAYNHADWYVDSVLMRARLIGGLPSNFVGSLTGLTQGRFPVHAKATYAGQVKTPKEKTKAGENAALVVESHQERRGIKIFARRAPRSSPSTTARSCARARTSGSASSSCCRTPTATPTRTGTSRTVSATYPAPKPRKTTKAKIAKELELPAADAKPTEAASNTVAKATSPKREIAPQKACAPPPTTCCPPPRPPSSACSPTRRARTPRPPAAPPSSATTTSPPTPPRSASTPRTS